MIFIQSQFNFIFWYNAIIFRLEKANTDIVAEYEMLNIYNRGNRDSTVVCRGQQFDGKVVHIFTQILGRLCDLST